MSRNKSNLYAILCIVALVLLLLIGWAANVINNQRFFTLCVIPMVGFIYFKFQDRCPHCGELLVRLPLYAKCCPYCGKDI